MDLSDSADLTALIDRLAEQKTLGAAPREELEWMAAHGIVHKLEAGEVPNFGLIQGIKILGDEERD